MLSSIVLLASLALAQNAEQNALDDVLEAQKREMQAERFAGRRELLASSYFLAERLYWTATLAVQSLPEAQAIGSGAGAQALSVDLADARRALSQAWSPSGPQEAAQALEKAETQARGLALQAAAAPALSLKNRALWIADSAAAIREELPRAEGDWSAMRAQSACYALEREVLAKSDSAPDSAFRVESSSSTVFAPGALAAIGLLKFSWRAGKLAETASLSSLAMNGTTLRAKLSLQRDSRLVWDKRAVLELDKPFSFDRTLDGRRFRVTLTQRRAGPDVCHLSGASAEALFDLPRD